MAIKLSNEQVLISGSNYARHALKKRIIKQALIEYNCAICKNNGQWLDKKLILQLDHINGIANDNRIENLRFICPNCHSQTDSFSGRNSKGMRCKDKIKCVYRTEKRIKDLKLWNDVKENPSIRFFEKGWKHRLGDLINISGQKVDQWLNRVDPVFYKSYKLD